MTLPGASSPGMALRLLSNVATGELQRIDERNEWGSGQQGGGGAGGLGSKGEGTAKQFGDILYSALVKKSVQQNTSTLYIQPNKGLEYDVQRTLNETMAAWAQEGTTMLNSVYVYNPHGQQIAQWVAGGGP